MSKPLVEAALRQAMLGLTACGYRAILRHEMPCHARACSAFRWRRPAVLLAVIALLLPAHPLLAAAGTFQVSRYVVEGVSPLSEAQMQQVLSAHVGQKSGLNDLVAASRALEQRLRQAGFVFYRVVLPPQTIADDTVRLRVEPLTISSVEVVGNQHFSADNVRRALPALQPGTPPTLQALSRSLSLANDHPARHVSLNLKEALTPDTVQAEIEVKDRRPWSLFSALSNVGSADSGRTRLSVGAQHGNLFGYDDALTASYTTSPEGLSDVQQYGLSYRVPVYAIGGAVSAYYLRSDVDSGTVQGVFDVSGAGDFVGVSFTEYLWQIGGYRQQVTVGLDDRAFSNDVRFLGTPIGSDVRTRPATLSYRGDYRGSSVAGGFTLSYARNVNGGADNDDAAYGQVRQGAQQDWDVLRLNANAAAALPGEVQVRSTLEIQFADEPLVPGEQFGVGGSASVRGLEERSVTGDDGVRGTLEVWAPPLPQGIQLLTFAEAGWVNRQDALPGEIHEDTVVGLGAGLRWQWRDTVALSLDYGYALTEPSTANAGRQKIHFNLFVRY